jgi:hypothetical protein
VSDKKPPRAIVLLGVQRFDPTLGDCVKALGVDGPIATITAGWAEREQEDTDLHEHLQKKTVNLRLYQRAEQAFARDRPLARAHRHKQEVLRHKQDFYRVRLEHELAANHVIRQRKAPPEILAEEEHSSIDAIRMLDEYHLAQCQRVHDEFEAEHKPLEHEAIAIHHRELGKILDRCAALCIAGGHVATILNRLRLFGIADLIDGQPVFAWTAGAMAIANKVVLYHDNPPQGFGAAEVLDRGLTWIDNVVPLPQIETRLKIDDTDRISVLARRFAPALCLGFPARAHVTFVEGKFERPERVMKLNEDGTHDAAWSGS